MAGFIESYKSFFELRNLILMAYSLTCFKVTWDFTNDGLPPKIDFKFFVNYFYIFLSEYSFFQKCLKLFILSASGFLVYQ